MVKAIIFDVGGVYLQGSFLDFAKKSCKVLGIENKFHTDKEIVFDSDYNRGFISVEECFRKYFGIPILDEQMDELIKIWTNTWTPTAEMISLVQKLQGDYRLAILSNSDKVNSEKYAERGWYSYFDVLVLSHEIGILKPDRRIYEITLDKLALPAQECIFIDDQEDVLKPAVEIGMKTILYESTRQLKKELAYLGIKAD